METLDLPTKLKLKIPKIARNCESWAKAAIDTISITRNKRNKIRKAGGSSYQLSANWGLTEPALIGARCTGFLR